MDYSNNAYRAAARADLTVRRRAMSAVRDAAIAAGADYNAIKVAENAVARCLADGLVVDIGRIHACMDVLYNPIVANQQAAIYARGDVREAAYRAALALPEGSYNRAVRAADAAEADYIAAAAAVPDGANNIPQHKIPELIAFLNGKMIDGISITAGYSPKNAGVKKQVIRVVFNIPGIASSQKPSFDININKYEVGKANVAVLDQEKQKLDEVMQHIMAFKNQQQGGRRIKYNKKRVTHKKRTRRIRRKHSRRN